MTTFFSRVYVDTLATVSPVRCAGCGYPDELCCLRCQQALIPQVHTPTIAIRRALFDVPVVAGLRFEGVARRVITGYKERGLVGLRHHLAPALRRAWARLDSEGDISGAIVVAVPPSGQGTMRRGRYPNEALILAAGLANRRESSRRILRQDSIPLSFAASGRVQKAQTRSQRIGSPPRLTTRGRLDGVRVVLVDDVVTTGITLEYAARAIIAAGGVVRGALALAATPPPGAKTDR